MTDSYQKEHERNALLGKLKEQYEPGPMRPRLYEVLEHNGVRLPCPSYEWMYYAGMGDVELMKTKPEEQEAIRSLLKDGRIVPGLSEDFWLGLKTIRRIKHFDDVNFGLDENSAPVIYEYSHSPEYPDPVIRPDHEYDAVIDTLKKRIQYGRAQIDRQPIQLQDGPTIWPVHTDERIVALRVRQQSYVPHQHMEP